MIVGKQKPLDKLVNMIQRTSACCWWVARTCMASAPRREREVSSSARFCDGSSSGRQGHGCVGEDH